MSVINENMSIAKEILLAMIEKDLLIFPAKTYNNNQEISEYNTLRANEVGATFDKIVEYVVKAQKGN